MARIIGMSRERIVEESDRLLNDSEAYREMSDGANPYGDGHSSERIVEAVARWYRKEAPLLPEEKQFKIPPRPQPRRRKEDLVERARTAAAGKE
jgi:UDP-N-acetylglucosamine 2-epimerase (non-hydrolysing)